MEQHQKSTLWINAVWFSYVATIPVSKKNKINEKCNNSNALEGDAYWKNALDLHDLPSSKEIEVHETKVQSYAWGRNEEGEKDNSCPKLHGGE